MLRTLTLLIGLGAALSAGCGGGGGPCAREDAQAALDAAQPGSTVELGSCAIEGPLQVPAGVTLRGTADTVVSAPEASAGIVVTPGEDATVVSDLRVDAGGLVGVLVRGTGAARLTDVEIAATHGIALLVTDVSDIALERVALEGPVDADRADDPGLVHVVSYPPQPGRCDAPDGCACDPGSVREADEAICDRFGRWATHTAGTGLHLVRSDATLRNVDVRGFARFGVVADASTVEWTGGSVSETLGIGIRQLSGALTLLNVAIDHTLQGLRGEPSYALAVTDGGRIDSSDLRVVNSDRYGLLQLGADGSHTNMIAEGNGDAALWVGEASELSLSGASTTLRDNGFAGLVAVETTDVVVRDAVVERTIAVERTLGNLGVLQIGDGIHLTRTGGSALLADLRLAHNGRAGAVVDLGMEGNAAIRFENVVVEGTGEQLGVVGGFIDANGDLELQSPAEWDVGVERVGAVAANDMAVNGLIDAVTLTAPADLPTSDGAADVIAPMF